jgi:Na+/H+ antiporter NhaC
LGFCLRQSVAFTRMTGRLRYVLAAAFVALFFLIPTADGEYIAFLQTRAWLTAKDGPLARSLEKDTLPPLDARVLISSDTIDGVTSTERRTEWAKKLQIAARGWARTNRKELDPGLTPAVLLLRVGDEGFRSDFAAPHVEPMRLELRRNSPPEDGYYPDRWSLLPAFLAIACAIVTAKVIPSLFLGCLAGAWLYSRQILGTAKHLLVDTIGDKVLLDEFNVEIMGFVVFLFMCVGVMTRAGGLQGMVELIRKYAKGPVSSQLCSFAIGILIFFDDYSNCIITGSTMRPLTDRNRVSREKLAYIVDSTAAPIAGISIFSTWVAYEVSMFAPQLPEVTKADGSNYTQSEGFSVFVATLPLRFYCIFTLVMVLATILMRREFGPMRRAEERALNEGKPYEDDAKPMISKGFEKLEPDPGTRCLARNALIPIVSLVALTLIGIFWLGHQGAVTAGDDLSGSLLDNINIYLQRTASQKALFWASAVALVIAAILALAQRILSIEDVVLSAIRSAKALGFAVVILVLAWTIGKICGDVGTSQFLTAAFGDKFDWMLPTVLFLISALVAFSTGTSYGTMAILLPNVIVLSHSIGADTDIGSTAMMFLTIGAVLEGSIFGDHCSPISDTTVLSSVATGSDHLHHVRTQAPYAVFVMIVSMGCGYIPMALLGPFETAFLGIPYWALSVTSGALAIYLWLRYAGRSPERVQAVA